MRRSGMAAVRHLVCSKISERRFSSAFLNPYFLLIKGESVFANVNPQQIAFFVILIIALALFVTEWIRTDVVAVLVVIALYVTRVLKPEEALPVFSIDPAIVIG